MNWCLTPGLQSDKDKKYKGDIMRQAPVHVYTRAGTARRCGKGMALIVGDCTFYLPPEEVGVLFSNRQAAIVNDEGEQEGMAWLSPLHAEKKQDLNALIMDRLFVVSYRDLHALLSGNREGIRVRESHFPLAI